MGRPLGGGLLLRSRHSSWLFGCRESQNSRPFEFAQGRLCLAQKTAKQGTGHPMKCERQARCKMMTR
jgi:hypothetical protein